MVSYELQFNREYFYGASDVGINVPIILMNGRERVQFDARLDTGSTFCVFRRGWAEALGINVESGTHERIGTVTGGFDAFGHTLKLETFGFKFDSMIFFAGDEGFKRDVVGRRGWLDKVRIGIIEYESKLYISNYNDRE